MEARIAFALSRCGSALVTSKPARDRLLAFAVLVLSAPVARRWNRWRLATATRRRVVEAFLVASRVVAAEIPTLFPIVAGQPRDLSASLVGQAVLSVLHTRH